MLAAMVLSDRFTALDAVGPYEVLSSLRGHGGSARATDYPLDGYSDDIRGLMNALGIGSAALVGHSLGGYAASVLAQREPGRVSRLVLEEPGMPRSSRAGGVHDLHGSRARGRLHRPDIRHRATLQPSLGA